MSDEGSTRPRWRDAVAVAALAIVIVAGLIHYGRGLGAETPGSSPSASSSASPTADATAKLDSSPTSGPATAPRARGGTCWDGRATASLRLCGLPGGARGLAWVFPSFAKDRALCHRARPNGDSYPVLESYECFQTALGEPVTITYDQVADPARVKRWLLLRVGREHLREISGPNGGRLVFRDGRTQPVRITAMYGRFPYVVSVYASSARAANQAWEALVRLRPEPDIRGVRAL